jgi:osmoprotectant transport system permease protein
VIAAGVRLATVTTIGLVTVTALIGLGGLGHFILQGIREFRDVATVVGSGLSVVLAVLADALLFGGERWLTPWAHRAGSRAVSPVDPGRLVA